MSADRGAPLSPVATPEEAQFERQLRPRSFEEYVGQDQAVASLRVSVEAARQRGECVDHVLLYGPPGLGKTTLAGILANEMSTNLVTTSGPAVERGVRYLLDTQRADGGWEDRFWNGTGFPRVFYLKYHLYAAYFPLWALGVYRRSRA